MNGRATALAAMLMTSAMVSAQEPGVRLYAAGSLRAVMLSRIELIRARE
jgi:hypothetical protein